MAIQNMTNFGPPAGSAEAMANIKKMATEAQGSATGAQGAAADPLAGWQKIGDQEALQVLAKNFSKFETAAGIGGADKITGDKDLKAMMNDESQPIELRQVAKKALEDKPFRNMINQGNEAGGNISLYEVLRALTGSNSQTAGADSPKPTAQAEGAGSAPGAVGSKLEDWRNMSDKDALQILSNNRGKLETAAGIGEADQIIGMRDLKATVTDESQPMELRQAAMKMLEDKPFRNLVNQGGEARGNISFAEIDKALARMANQTSGTNGVDSPKPSSATAANADTAQATEPSASEQKNGLEKMLDELMEKLMEKLMGMLLLSLLFKK